ncbi:MAG: TolC family protein, partial [Bacteroidota bacterium]
MAKVIAKSLLLVALLGVGLQSPLQPVMAQSGTESLTLQQAIVLAVEHHPSLKAAEANIASASGSLTQAKSAYMPSLNLSATAQRTDGAFVFNPSFPPRNQSYNNYSAGLQINQTLFDFGRTINRVSANSGFLDASSLDFEAARGTVIANVQIAYFGAVQARQVARVNEEAFEQGSRHLAQAKAFYNVGRRPLFDVTKAEVDLANANVNLIRARNQLRVANLQLENAMGVHPKHPFTVSDTLSVTPFAL